MSSNPWNPECQYPATFLGQHYCPFVHDMHPRAQLQWDHIQKAVVLGGGAVFMVSLLVAASSLAVLALFAGCAWWRERHARRQLRAR